MTISKTFISFLLIFSGSAYGQTYSNIITDKEIFTFIESDIQAEKLDQDENNKSSITLSYEITSWDTFNLIKPDTFHMFYNHVMSFEWLFNKKNHLDTIFNAKDIKFLFKQFTNIKDSLWRKPFANSVLTKENPKEIENPSLYFYSIPLFSIDRKYAIVKRIYHCGSLCAYGGYFIYKKDKKNKWTYVRPITYWNS